MKLTTGLAQLYDRVASTVRRRASDNLLRCICSFPALVEQLVAPGLRARNPQRRKDALDDLEALSRVAQELTHLLLVRELRTTVERTG